MTPAHSFLIVIALFVIVAGLLTLMFKIDGYLNRRAAEREEAAKAGLAPVIDLDAKRQARGQKHSVRNRLAPNEAPYDWKVQGL